MSGYGLVLSGGGAKGSFEIGVWKALREMNVPITAVAGTSVGALNGAVIAQNQYDAALEFWTNLTMDQVVEVNKQITEKYITQWSKDDFESFAKSFKNYIFDGGLDTTPLRNSLNKFINEDLVRKSKMKLGIVTVSLKDFKPLEIMIDDIPEGKLIDYLMASASFPIFKRHKIDGLSYIDGGLYDNLPINLLASNGYKNLITVEFPALAIYAKVKYNDLNILTINNSEHLGLTLDFNPKNMKRNIDVGYLDCLRTFKKVKGKTYYIDMNGHKNDFLIFSDKIGSSLKGDNLIKLPLLLGKDTLPSTKKDLQSEIKKIINYTQYKDEDLSLAMIEITAKNLEINRIKKYTPDELIKEIFETTNNILNNNIDIIKNNKSIFDIFKETKENNSVRPITNIKFMMYYIYFLSLKSKSLIHLEKLISRFTPETTISIITLLYLTDRD